MDGDSAADAAACVRDACHDGHGRASVARLAGDHLWGISRTPGGQPMSGVAAPPAADHETGFVKTYLWSTDHKIIALQYRFTGMFMALIGGFAAYVFRLQLAFPGQSVRLSGRVSAGQYTCRVQWPGRSR